MSKKYFELEERYQKLLHQCKKTYFKSKMNRLKSSGGKQWWKEINNIIDNKNEDIEVEEIMNYSPQQQVEMIATKFASISQEYEPLNRDELSFPPFNTDDIPRISEHGMKSELFWRV